MKNFSFILFLVCSLVSVGQTRVESELEKVTVYRYGAIMERSADVSLTSNTKTLYFTDIPNGLIANAIQVKAPDNVRLLKVNYRYLTPEELGIEDLTVVGKKIDQMEDRITAEQDIQVSLNEDLQFIGANTKLRGDMTAQEIQAADAYLQSRRREIRDALRASIEKVKGLQEESQQLRAQLAEMEDNLGKPKSIIEVEIRVERSMTGKFQISYFSPKAKWTPFYNVRARDFSSPLSFEFMGTIVQNTGENWDDVNLSLSTGNPSLGAFEPQMNVWEINYNNNYVPSAPEIRQNALIASTGSFHGFVLEGETGRPIPYATVTLTFGNEKNILVSNELGEVKKEDLSVGAYSVQCQYQGYNTLNTSIQISGEPQLSKLSLNRNGSSLMANIVITGGTPAQYGDTHSGYLVGSGDNSRGVEFIDGVKVRGSMSIPNSVVRNFERKSQAISTMYTIDRPFSLSSNGRGQDVWIQTMETNAEYLNRTYPALSENVFAIARIEDWESLDLLEGTTNFFFEGTFNGSGYINPNTTNDTLALALGVDQGVVFERTRLNARSSQHTFSSKVDETFIYKIVVRNTKTSSVNLDVLEQFPISNDEDVEVSEQMAEGAEVDPKTGIITWNKTLAPGEEWTIQYSFEVTYPQELRNALNLPE
ncbi:MAG: mucoidy inhibitor MuiA family protein [Flavobacteriia bacterium]|nr:mucoidy inhibitor MuiA family protein [Flavobacteriia bacterium]